MRYISPETPPPARELRLPELRLPPGLLYTYREPQPPPVSDGESDIAPRAEQEAFPPAQKLSLPRIPRSIHPTSTGLDIRKYLQKLNAQQGTPHIFDRAISFHSGTDRTNWAPVMIQEDWENRATVIEFCTSGRKDHHTWLGFCSCPADSWVAKPEWTTEFWHCYLVAVIANRSGGKQLVIWDCDPKSGVTGTTRVKTALTTTMQREMLKYYTTRSTVEVWYYAGQAFSRRNKCLLFSMEQLLRWAEMGDPVFQGPADPRVKDCVRLCK